MNKLIKPLLPLCAILLASCSSDDEIVTPNEPVTPTTASDKKMSFSASINENVTRAEFDSNNKTVWSTGDEIWVYNASVSANNQKRFILSSGNGTKDGKFDGEALDILEGENTNNFYAFYPYNENVSFSNNTVSANIPSVQKAKENLFETGYQYMTAHTQGSAFSFRNLVSFFKVTVKSSDDFKISRIKIVANNVTQEDGTASDQYTKTYLNIAGDFSVDISNETGDNSGKPSNLTITGNASNYVETTITPDTEAEHTYYLAVLPTTDNLKFTLLLESDFAGDNGQKVYQATNSGHSFAAGKIIDLGTYDAATLSNRNKVLDNVVDLDLPSGTIWATTNVGASAPTEKGDFYRWGRLEPYGQETGTNVNTTAWYNASSKPFELATDHDVAYQKYPSESSPLKGKYVMPNKDQAKELTIGGYVYVPELETASNNDNPAPYYKVCSAKNKDHYILLPVGGRQTHNANYDNQAKASYWSKTRANNTERYWYDFRPSADFNANSSDGSTTLIGMTAYYPHVSAYRNTDSYNYGRQIRAVVLNKNVAPASEYPN